MTELQFQSLDGLTADFNVKEFEQYFLQNDFSSPPSDLSPVSFSPSLDSPQGSPSRDQNSPSDYVELPALTFPPIPSIQPTLYNIEHNYIFEQEPPQHIISIKGESQDFIKQSEGGTNSRKRKTANSRVQIPREELLKMTSKRETSPSLATPDNRSLTPEEDRVLKRQKRLIKNRESAQLSRLRKKIYIEELERRVSVIAAENKALQDEVMYLRNMVKQLGASPPTNMFQTQQSSIASTLPPINMFSPNANKFPQKNLGTAGVCLLIILFSFGLFFNNTNEPMNDRPSFLRQEIPEVMPKMRTGRTLKSLSEDDMDEDEDETMSKQIVQKNMSKSRRAIADEINEVEKALSSNNWRTRVKQEMESDDEPETYVDTLLVKN